VIRRKKKSSSTEDYTVDVFTDLSVSEAQIVDAKETLMKAGYRVLPPLIVNGEIDSKQKLINYFYMRLDSKHPDRQRRRVRNPGFDMAIASKFVESQMEGTNESTAIQQCVSIIDVLFDYESEFNFKYPVTDIGIFGQGKLSWITTKALTILSRKRNASFEKDAEKKIEAIEDAYQVDSSEISNNLDALLKKLEENDGEE